MDANCGKFYNERSDGLDDERNSGTYPRKVNKIRGLGRLGVERVVGWSSRAELGDFSWRNELELDSEIEDVGC